MLSEVLSPLDDSTAAASVAVANSTENSEIVRRCAVSFGDLNSTEESICQTRKIQFARSIGSIVFFAQGLVGTKMAKGILANEQGKIGWILLWALGVPIPLLLLLFLVRGCT